MTAERLIILTGPYQRGLVVLVTEDDGGRIVDCPRLSCVWSGTPRFDAWFRAQYLADTLDQPEAEPEQLIAAK